MTEVNSEVVIIGDSWLNTNRLKTIVSENQGKEPTISLFPHKGPTGYTATLKNLSKGSLAMSQVMEDQELLGKWIRSKPIVTVLHTYACDIINKKNSITPAKGMSVGTHYTNFMLSALDYMRDFAKDTLSNQEYEVWQNRHKFLVFALPDWKNFEQERPDSLDAVQYRALRSKINQTLKKKKNLFWKKYKALVINPAMSQVQMIGVHLHPYFQSLYNNFLLRSVEKLICTSCGLKPDATMAELCTAANGSGCLSN